MGSTQVDVSKSSANVSVGLIDTLKAKGAAIWSRNSNNSSKNSTTGDNGSLSSQNNTPQPRKHLNNPDTPETRDRLNNSTNIDIEVIQSYHNSYKMLLLNIILDNFSLH